LGLRAVDVGHERVEPHHVGGEAGIHRRIGRQREGQRAGQEVDAQVRPGAGLDQVLNLRIGLGMAELGCDVDHDDVGDRKSDGAT